MWLDCAVMKLNRRPWNAQLKQQKYIFSHFWRFSSAQLLTCIRLFVTPLTATHQASLSITNSQSPLKLMSIKSVMPSNYLILCRPLFLLPSIIPSIRVFSNTEFREPKSFLIGSQQTCYLLQKEILFVSFKVVHYTDILGRRVHNKEQSGAQDGQNMFIGKTWRAVFQQRKRPADQSS